MNEYKQLEAIVLKMLNDIDFPFNKEKGIESMYFMEEEKLLRGNPPGQTIPVWIASVEFGQETLVPNLYLL